MIHNLRYHPSSDQLALADTFNESLESLLDLQRLRLSSEESEKTWSMLESLGLFGITASEDAGGSGLGAAEEVLIVMALGRRLATPSILATIGATHAWPEVPKESVSTVRTAAAYVHRDRIVIVEDTKAERVLVRNGARTALYRSETPLQSISLEEHLWLSPLREASELPDLIASFDADALNRLRLIDAAVLAGIAEAALEMSVNYASVRSQFNRLIGSFQAVKHHCANMAISARKARDQACFAAIAVDDKREDAVCQTDSALLTAATAAIDNSSKNIQIHGGIGFSDEADPHLLLKRARVLVALAGGLEDCVSRVSNVVHGD